MQLFPNGTVFSVSTALLSALVLSAISNANPAVASCATPPADGTIGIIGSDWPLLNNRIAKTAGEVAGTSFKLSGFDTTDTSKYPAASNTGTFAPVDTWVTLSQVTNIAKSGGAQQYYQWQYAEDATNQQQQRPTFKNAKTLTLTLDYDPAKAWYAALDTIDQAQDAVVLRAVLPNGKELYYYVYPSFDKDPSMDLNKNMENTATFSLISQLTQY